MSELNYKKIDVLSLSLDGFEGPIDLLLSLARDHKIDLTKLSILTLAEQYLDFLDHVLVGEKPMRFNQHDNRLYIDMDWENDLSVGEYLVIECYRKLDPTEYTDIFNDIYLKRYVTALFKKQWR